MEAPLKKFYWFLLMIVSACACGSDRCQNECLDYGQRECYEEGYRFCDDLDNNFCLEWNYDSCGEWYECKDDGVCVKTCPDECEFEGQSKLCFDDTQYTCGYYDSDPCLDLGEPVPCGPGAGCKYGECLPLGY